MDDRNTSALRLPPHSIEAEQAVLGGLLLNNSVWDDTAEILAEDDFYRFDHRLIWRQIAALLAHGRPADTLTVIDALKQVGQLDEAGGATYLATLSNSYTSAANIRHYAQMVHDRAVLRRVIAVSDEIASDAFDANNRPVNEVLDAAEAKMFKIAEESGKKSNSFQQLDSVAAKVISRIDELYNCQ